MASIEFGEDVPEWQNCKTFSILQVQVSFILLLQSLNGFFFSAQAAAADAFRHVLVTTLDCLVDSLLNRDL